MVAAVVMGDEDLVRPLALAGHRCAVFAAPGAAVRLSRDVDARLIWRDHWTQPRAVVDELLRFAERAPRPLTLLPQTDADLLVVSRHRDALAPAYRMALADAAVVETLMDKARFGDAAHALGLPVPAQRCIAASDDLDADGLRFPLIVKPLVRRAPAWKAIEAHAKAVCVRTPEDLDALRPLVRAANVPVLLQEAIDGPETAIESYHAYIDDRGEIAGEFTGCKIRTRPEHFGHSTAVTVNWTPDVAALGRRVLRAFGVRGVAKVDVKRDADGALHVLEVNPRFNLWHHPGAIAGVNLPALVVADLLGLPRPATGPLREGVVWCRPIGDARAAREQGVPPREWLSFLRSADAVSGFAPSDPLPLAGAVMEAGYWRYEALRNRTAEPVEEGPVPVAALAPSAPPISLKRRAPGRFARSTGERTVVRQG